MPSAYSGVPLQTLITLRASLVGDATSKCMCESRAGYTRTYGLQPHSGLNVRSQQDCQHARPAIWRHNLHSARQSKKHADVSMKPSQIIRITMTCLHSENHTKLRQAFPVAMLVQYGHRPHSLPTLTITLTRRGGGTEIQFWGWHIKQGKILTARHKPPIELEGKACI